MKPIDHSWSYIHIRGSGSPQGRPSGPPSAREGAPPRGATLGLVPGCGLDEHDNVVTFRVKSAIKIPSAEFSISHHPLPARRRARRGQVVGCAPGGSRLRTLVQWSRSTGATVCSSFRSRRPIYPRPPRTTRVARQRPLNRPFSRLPGVLATRTARTRDWASIC